MLIVSSVLKLLSAGRIVLVISSLRTHYIFILTEDVIQVDLYHVLFLRLFRNIVISDSAELKGT
jgi:hypothetical protein